MADGCCLCGLIPHENIEILFVKQDGHLICEPCVDLAKHEFKKYRNQEKDRKNAKTL